MSGIVVPLLGPVTLGNAGIWTLVGGFIVAWFRFKPLMAKLRNESDGSLRSDLLKRIGALEQQQIDDRKAHSDQREKDRLDCFKETDALRQQIREQDKLIDGLQRQLIMFQVATGRALPLGANSPEIERMLASLGPLFNVQAAKSETLRSAEETCAAAEVTVEQVKQDEVNGIRKGDGQ